MAEKLRMKSTRLTFETITSIVVPVTIPVPIQDKIRVTFDRYHQVAESENYR